MATPHGERTIGSLTVGTQVVAYNPATKHSSMQTVQHVFIDHDSDLLDVTLRSTPTRGPPAAHHSQHSQKQPAAAASHEETVHTTASHPWLSADRGWVRAGALHLGEQVMRADGTTATVVGLRVVSGAAAMWDLTVSRVHTFAVGDGQFVVHNCGETGQPDPNNQVPGQPNLYNGQQYDELELASNGFKRSPLGDQSSIGSQSSQQFEDYIRATRGSYQAATRNGQGYPITDGWAY